ncbi:MAG: hypothetical protein EBR40_00515 [Proteobacteria bacterium]|nr:hypothetical protein [Pseudomonadota bacterium]
MNRFLASPALLTAFTLLLLGTFFRVLRVEVAPEVLPNFSPLMASALCGALFLPGWIGLAVPVVALLVSDLLLNLHYGAPLLSAQLLWTLPGYLVAVAIGWSLRGRTGLIPVLGGTLAASVFFYVVTNTGSWSGLTAYPQTFAGWVQALTVGLPGYPPTWTFFRNSLAGDLLSAAFFVVMEQALTQRKARVIA